MPETTKQPDREIGAEEDFRALFERSLKQPKQGEGVTGRVVLIGRDAVTIDIGYKSEGTIPIHEFTTREGELTVHEGDEVDVYFEASDTESGDIVLSRKKAEQFKVWREIEKAYERDGAVEGTIVGKVKGGLKVDIGVAAFLPGSHADLRPTRNLDRYIGQRGRFAILKFNRSRGNVVVSRRSVLERERTALKSETLKVLEEGVILEGTVKNITDYGAFVDLGGIDGLLHVTDMSWGRLQNPSELFKVGDTVQVKVLKFDRERERVSLGYKQLLPDPWETIAERFPPATRITGKIASVADYGAFVELEPGVEGLVHVSEMSWSKRIKHPSKIVNPGDTVEVEVLSVDPRARRVSLGMKQVQENPWKTIGERYHAGDRVHGRVRNLTDFGAFIEIEDGVDGLVHVSDISWSRRVKHPGEVLKKGQQVDAVITTIDPENRRMSLSIKELEPNAWNDFVAAHKPGDIVKGKIARFAGFGAFVELGDNLEGLCHISELSDERVSKPEDAVQLGQEMEFRILRIDAENKKIGLSARAAAHEEPIIETKVYTSEAGGGMASLAELADFGTSSRTSDDEQT